MLAWTSTICPLMDCGVRRLRQLSILRFYEINPMHYWTKVTHFSVMSIYSLNEARDFRLQVPYLQDYGSILSEGTDSEVTLFSDDAVPGLVPP